MTGSQDPWKDALDRHTTPGASDLTAPLEGLATDGGPVAGRVIRMTRPWIAVAGACLAVLLAGGGYAAFLAYENNDRADRWRDRSVLLEDLVADRTKALNRQTARLNVAATGLRKARTAIASSERDVAGLERRQRELANEKAQIEDERAQLLLVADQLETCNAGLRGLIVAVGSGFTPDPNVVATTAGNCNAADSAVRGYLAAFGDR